MDYKRIEEEYNKRYQSKKSSSRKGVTCATIIIITMVILYVAACYYGIKMNNPFIVLIALALYIIVFTFLYICDLRINKDKYDAAHQIRMESLDETVVYFLPGEKTYSKKKSFISVAERDYYSSFEGKILGIRSGARKIIMSLAAFVLSLVPELMPNKNIKWLIIIIITFGLGKLLNTDYFKKMINCHRWFYRDTIVRYKEYLEEQEIMENEHIIKDKNESISDRIFSKAKEKGISDDQLSQRTGISCFCIDEWRNNNKAPRAEEIMAICEALEVTPEWLLEGVNELNRPK